MPLLWLPRPNALFVMTGGAVLDTVTEAFKGEHMELIQSNLSNEQEAQLSEQFGA